MSAPTPLARTADLQGYCDKKRLQYPDVILYFSIKREGVGSGKIKKTDRTEFKDIRVSPTEESAMRPGCVYTITNNKDKDRVYFIATTGGIDTALTAVIEKTDSSRSAEDKRDALVFLSEQVMRGAQINSQQLAGMEKLTTFGLEAEGQRLKQLEVMAGIQEKQAILQEKLDKKESIETSVKGLVIIANKIVDAIVHRKDDIDKETNDALQLGRLLVSHGITPSVFRAAVEALGKKGVTLADIVQEGLSTEQSTEQEPETE